MLGLIIARKITCKVMSSKQATRDNRGTIPRVGTRSRAMTMILCRLIHFRNNNEQDIVKFHLGSTMHLGWLGSLDIHISEGIPLLRWCPIRRPASLCFFFLQRPHEVKEILDCLGRGLNVHHDARPINIDGLFERSGTFDDLPIFYTDGRRVIKQLLAPVVKILF